jgi:hypothetical protein
MQKGQEVILIKSVYSHVRHKNVKIGTKGVILGVRHSDERALVKLKGYAWPISVNWDSIN